MITSSAQDKHLLVGLVSDTHGVFDEEILEHFKDVGAIIHAGDIGDHGGAEGILQRLRSIAPVTAVRGNVDEGEDLPEVATLELHGLSFLVIHILGKPSKPTPAVANLLAKHQPDVVVFGHSHTYLCEERGGKLYVNPGSAGPARFKLGRSVAVVDLPLPGTGERPVVRKISLAAKAPPRLTSSTGRKRRRKG